MRARNLEISRIFNFLTKRFILTLTALNSACLSFTSSFSARFPYVQQNYKKPDSMNLRNLYMHLTNYSLNKNSEKFKKPDASFMNGNDNSSKQLLTNVYKKLASRGRDVRHIKRQIEELAAKTVIALEPYLKNAYHCFVSADHSNPRCF